MRDRQRIVMYQYYKIAGLTVKMNTFGRTADLALPYRIEPCSNADITIESIYREWNEVYPDSPVEALEYVATGKAFYRKLLEFDGMMLHASAIAADGKAYLFSAESGVGKSTHTQLWRQHFGSERVSIINDDKPALRQCNGVWYAFGTPWSGKHGLNQNVCYPLAGICFIERGTTNRIEPYTGNDIIFRFLKNTYRYKDAECSDKILSYIGSIIESIPVWRLECNMEAEAAYAAYEAMTGKLFSE